MIWWFRSFLNALAHADGSVHDCARAVRLIDQAYERADALS